MATHAGGRQTWHRHLARTSVADTWSGMGGTLYKIMVIFPNRCLISDIPDECFGVEPSIVRPKELFFIIGNGTICRHFFVAFSVWDSYSCASRGPVLTFRLCIMNEKLFVFYQYRESLLFKRKMCLCAQHLHEFTVLLSAWLICIMVAALRVRSYLQMSFLTYVIWNAVLVFWSMFYCNSTAVILDSDASPIICFASLCSTLGDLPVFRRSRRQLCHSPWSVQSHGYPVGVLRQ